VSQPKDVGSDWSLSYSTLMLGVTVFDGGTIEVDATGRIHERLGGLDLGTWQLSPEATKGVGSCAFANDLAALSNQQDPGEGMMSFEPRLTTDRWRQGGVLADGCESASQ